MLKPMFLLTSKSLQYFLRQFQNIVFVLLHEHHQQVDQLPSNLKQIIPTGSDGIIFTSARIADLNPILSDKIVTKPESRLSQNLSRSILLFQSP